MYWKICAVSFFFMTKEVLKVNKDKEELQRLKEKNNPFLRRFPKPKS